MQDSEQQQDRLAALLAGPVAEQGFSFRPASIDSLRAMRILIVDDLPTNIILMQAILEHGGFANQVTADSGSKAIDLLHKNTRNSKCTIDLVLLDIILPGQNGFSICRMMRDNPVWQNIPVIMVTSEAKWREETAQASYESGATEILFKPVRSSELLPRVIAALHLKHERDQRIRHEKALQQKLHENALLETRLKYLVSHDDLTGLFNRRRLGQVIELGAIYARYYQHSSALLVLDIDNFTRVNEIAGHSNSDQLLSDVAAVLRLHAQHDNLVARIGADEFAIFMDNGTLDSATALATQLLAEISSIGVIHDEIAGLTASIGIALVDGSEVSRSSEFIAQAEQACKQAMHAGGNRVCVFNKDDTSLPAARQRSHWKPRLRQALDGDGFEVELQPLIDATDDSVVAHSLLLRLRDGERLYTPSSFLDVAENSGLIREIDDWVICRAFALLSADSPILAGCPLHIHVSHFSLHDPRILALLQQLLKTTTIPAERLCIHFEGSVTRHKDAAVSEQLLGIAALGCQLVFDDFDTSYDFCKRLEELPVNMLKIRSCYVHDIANDELNQALVRTMVDITHSLGKKIIASHIDKPETLVILKQLGVDLLQGSLPGKPVLLGPQSQG